MDEIELSKKWREMSLCYVASVNEYVRKGSTEGWDNAGDEPKDDREPLAKQVIDAVREANRGGQTEGMHEKFPPAHSPFHSMLEANGQNISPVVLLDDGRIVARVGAPYQENRVVVINGTDVSEIPGVLTFGRSPCRKHFAMAGKDGVKVLDGWDGPVVAELDWPTGLEGLPTEVKAEAIKCPPDVDQLIPFPDGQRVLLVGQQGIYVLTLDGVRRLSPSNESIVELYKYLNEDGEEEKYSFDESMAHGAISRNGKWIAVGSQDTNHLVFDEEYRLVGDIGPQSSYPHYSMFSADDSVVVFNSCHFYNGFTIGVDTSLLRLGFSTPPYQPSEDIIEFEMDPRVYAGAAHEDFVIVGDANGYLKAFDMKGKTLWQHFIGSSVSHIDISEDGKRLIATTYAGFLSIIDLDTEEPDPFVIGTGTNSEVRRWLFWSEEDSPLVW